MDFIITIITDIGESNHLRALGITGFKNKLISAPEKVFENFWPIFTNKTEYFDVRVAALDLLLSTNLPEDKFDNVAKYFMRHPKDAYEQNLFQYFHTTITTILSSPNHADALILKYKNLLKHENYSKYAMKYHAWSTSNYKIAYADKELNNERNLQLRLVTNPVTNGINTIQLSYNNVYMSFDIGSFNIYLKLDGVPEVIYKNKLKKKLANKDMSIPELLALMKEFNYEMKNENFKYHVDIVIFMDNRAVFALNRNSDNGHLFEYYIEKYLAFFNDKAMHIYFPLIEYINIPSDLGTPVTIMNYIQDVICTHKHIQVFRESWSFQTWLETYNPLAKTKISSYKYFGNEKSMNASIDLEHWRYSLAYIHWNDSFNYAWDNVLGTTVEHKDILNYYCPECDDTYEISTDNTNTELKELDIFTMKINQTSMQHEKYVNFSAFITDHVKLYQNNIMTFPLAEPFLFHWHYQDFVYSNYESSRGVYRSIPYYQNESLGIFKLQMNKNYKVDSINTFGSNNFTIGFKCLDVMNGKTILRWNATLGQHINPEYTEENSKFKTAQIKTFDYEYFEFNKTRKNINLLRRTLFPPLRNDKYSILPQDAATGTTEIQYCNKPENSEDCVEFFNVLFSEKYWTSDELENSIKSSQDYAQCNKQKEGLKYTPITKECVVNSHMLLNQYDNFETKLELINASKSKFLAKQEHPILKYERKNQNEVHIQIPFQKWTVFLFDDEKSFLNYVTYYPYLLLNPTEIAYNYNEGLSLSKKSCIIAPTKVITFTSNVIAFDEKNPVAIVECLEKTLRGLKIHKVNDKHIGFKLWLENNTISATVIDENKMQIELNENVIEHTLYDEENNFKITFSDDVIFVNDDKILLYYNTEYVSITIDSEYSSQLCGLCSNQS